MSTATANEVEFNAVQEYAKLRIGQLVEASTDPNGTRPGMGIICGIEGQSVAILFAASDSSLGDRLGILSDCWLIKDPRVKMQPGLINDQERRAVFWLADNEVAFQEYAKQIAALTAAIDQLVMRVGAVEGNKPAQQDPPRRGPGRPRKDEV